MLRTFGSDNSRVDEVFNEDFKGEIQDRMSTHRIERKMAATMKPGRNGLTICSMS